MRPIDLDDDRHCYVGNDGEYERWNIDPEASTIDAVKVVRCQDCKYSRPYRLDEYTCEKEHDCGDYTVPFDWFCADGERREVTE